MIAGDSWPDIAAFAAGNTGVPFVWSFAASAPGPHVMVNCLTHGNEPAGAAAVARLLASGVRPKAGRLTLSFANVAGYEALRAGRDLPARFLDRDMNRLWHDDWIDGDRDSREATRARELRPVLRSVDMLLDLHTTASVAQPFFVIADLPKARALADRMAWPPIQQLMPGGCLDGRHMIDYGAFSDAASTAVAVTVECGRHFDQTSADAAWAAANRFFAVTGIIDPPDDSEQPHGAIRRFRIVEPYVLQSDRFSLCISDAGFASVAAGERVAIDGGVDVVAAFDATIIAPRPNPTAGTTGFLWAVEVS